MITNNYSAPAEVAVPILFTPSPVAAPEHYEDPQERPDKWDLAEALIELLDDSNLNKIGHVFASYNTEESSDIFLQTFPNFNDDMAGTNFRISITRSKTQ